MKKFSFLLAGVFLLWTITFALAEESKDVEANTWSTIEANTWDTVEVATWDTAEVATWDTAEVATWDTAEIATWDTAEIATWDTAEIATWDTVEVATWNTAEIATWDTAKIATWDTAEVSENTDTAKSKYSEEQVTAYEWALEKGITTINDIEKARLTDGLTRAELAKMMSQYMTKVLWKTPVDAEKVEYFDVNESLGDLADYIQTAYAYKIMWINADGTPIKKFNPNGKVTRAEYATVFSRVLFGDKYNKSEWNYYEDHLNALKEAGILTNTTPTIQEVRGWVMLMMYRSENANIQADTQEATTEENSAEESTGATIWMPNPAAVYCEKQGGTINIVKDAEWNESGMCKLADGTEVEEWEYYRANNKTEEATTTETSTSSEETTTTEAATWDTAETPAEQTASSETK